MSKLDTLAVAYLRTTYRRLFRNLTPAERAGRFVAEAQSPEQALTCSLLAGDQDAALALADALVVVDLPRAGNRVQPPMSGSFQTPTRRSAA
jgi:hypothetical protein